jgi:hypothetical protein
MVGMPVFCWTSTTSTSTVQDNFTPNGLKMDLIEIKLHFGNIAYSGA